MNAWSRSFFAKKRTTGRAVINVCAFSFVASSWFFFCGLCEGALIPSGEVWKKAQEVGRKNDVDPLLIYSIACAESSLDDRADSGQARGIMQMSHLAWTEVSKRSYEDAWNWQINMEVAAKYLHYLRRRLENSGRYTAPLLAAAYHYGPGKVANARYRFTRLPRANNKIYKALFAGRIPKLPGTVPFRSIDSPASIQAFRRPEPKIALSLPVLEEGFYNEIPYAMPDVLELVPLTPFRQDEKILEPSDADEAGASRMLEPVIFGNPDLSLSLVKVPDLQSLFVIKYLKLVNKKDADSPALMDASVAAGAKSDVSTETPPAVNLLAPVELDTSVDGIFIPVGDNAALPGLPELDTNDPAAPEE